MHKPAGKLLITPMHAYLHCCHCMHLWKLLRALEASDMHSMQTAHCLALLASAAHLLSVTSTAGSLTTWCNVALMLYSACLWPQQHIRVFYCTLSLSACPPFQSEPRLYCCIFAGQATFEIRTSGCQNSLPNFIGLQFVLYFDRCHEVTSGPYAP